MKLRCDGITSLILGGILYFGCLLPADAQNPTCPTRPPGDSTNACASTAFVHSALPGQIPLTQYHFLIGDASNKAADTALGGDCTYTSSYGIVCTKTNNVPFGPFATGTDSANLTNLGADLSASGGLHVGAFTGDVSKSAGSLATTVTAVQGKAYQNTTYSNGQVPTWNSANNRFQPGSGGGGGVFPVSNYGSVCDYRAASDGAMASGSSTLTTSTGQFLSTDVGKYIAVQGAGTAGATLFTTIAGYTNSNTVTLTNPNASGGAISGKFIEFGTDDTAAFQAAINAAITNSGGTVQMPMGSCFVTRLNLAGISLSINLQGFGVNGTRIFPLHNSSYGTSNGHVIDLTGSAFVKLSNFQLGAYYTLAQPTTGIFMAQVASNVSNRIEFYRLYISGQYSVATLYDYGVPSSVAWASDFYNYTQGAGSHTVMYYTANNAASLTSSFATVTSGTFSTGDWSFFKCEFHRFAGVGAASSVIITEGVQLLGFYGGVISGGASSYVQFNGTNENVLFSNIVFETESEPVVPANAYAINGSLRGLYAPQSYYILSGQMFGGSGALSALINNTPYLANSGSAINPGTTYVGTGIADTVAASNVASLMTDTGVVANMRATTSASPGSGQSYTITLQINGVDTGITCSMSNAVNSCSDTTHFANVPAGASINFKIVSSGGANVTRLAASVSFTPFN